MSGNLIKSSVGVTFVLVLGYVLSFVKESVIANYYGVSQEVDAYTIAIQIPVTLFAFISVALHSVVIPLYSDLLYNQGKERAKSFIDHLISIISIFSLLLILFGEIFADQLIYLFAPGFNEGAHSLATELLRLIFPVVLFTVLSNILLALLNTNKQFILPSFGVFFLNVGIIICIVILHLEYGIASACIGQVVGAILNIVYLYWLCRGYYQYRFRFSLKDDFVKKALKMSLPILLSISVAEINTIVNRIVASFLFVGSISALGYASKLNTVFMSLFISAIATIIYPLYAESSANNNMKQLNIRVNTTLAVYSLFIIPLMCGLYCFKSEIVTVVFARGVFDEEAVKLTQELLGCYTLGLLFMALRETITKVFYSLKDTRTPAKNAIIGVILNIVLNLILSYFLGVKGLALATSITALFIASRLLMLLIQKNKVICLDYFFSNLWRIGLASFVMFIMILAYRDYVEYSNILYFLLLGVLIGSVVYSVCIFILKLSILNDLLLIIKRKS